MPGESYDFEIRPTEPGTIEDLATAFDIASGMSDVGTSIGPLEAQELREWGTTEEGRRVIEFFRKITSLEE